MTILSDALFLASALVDECERNGIPVDQAQAYVHAAADGGKRATISLESPDGRAVAERLRLPRGEDFYYEGRRMRSAYRRTGRWVVDTHWAVGGEIR